MAAPARVRAGSWTFSWHCSPDRVLAASIPQSVDVGAQAKPVASSVYVDAGYVELAWSWQGTRNCDATFDPF